MKQILCVILANTNKVSSSAKLAVILSRYYTTNVIPSVFTAAKSLVSTTINKQTS